MTYDHDITIPPEQEMNNLEQRFINIKEGALDSICP